MKVSEHILIVGIGSAHGDDQVGWRVVAGLSALTGEKKHLAAGVAALPENIHLRVAKTPADLLDWLEGGEHRVERLVICDASHGSGKVGEIRNWNWPSPGFSEVTMSGTHNLSLPTVLALAEQLGRLPRKISIWTIEGALDKGTNSISPDVLQAIPELVKRIVRFVKQPQPIQELPCTNNR